MRSIPLLLLFALATGAAAQSLPDAPSTLKFKYDPAIKNPLPIVNGRHYRPITEGERLNTFARGLVSPGAFAGALYSAGYRQLRDRPDPMYWDTDAAGFGKRFGAAYGQRVINQGTRYVLGAALHEDNRYLICHGCTLKQKVKNSLLADFTARHGADGHRTFSPTGIAGGFSGSLVAYAFWYPNQDPRFTVQRGFTNALIGFATRPASHFASEILDGHKIPLIHRHFGDSSPAVRYQLPTAWLAKDSVKGELPVAHRENPAQPDTPGSYAEVWTPPAAAANGEKAPLKH